jgi:hypothetical protein
VFDIDVAKVDRDVAYVAVAAHVCCKRLFPISSVFSDICCKCVYLDVTDVSHICCKRFIWILRMFAMIFNCFQVFLQMF